MIWLSDETVERLRQTSDPPDFDGTRYRLGEEIARGGMGIVYAAEDRELGRQVAVKVLGTGALSDGAVARIIQEARILAGLEHPAIVPVHDAGLLLDGRAFYVMKLVRGARLERHVRELHSLAELLRLFLRICEAVAFANARGVIHRDLKPENVMIGEFGEVLVMDWGVAKVIGETALEPEGFAWRIARGDPTTVDGEVVGTPGYMAPEQMRGEAGSIDARTDVYSLGAMLSFLAGALNRREPIPRPLWAIIGKAMAAEKSERYGGAGELAADIARFLDGERVSAHRESILERGGRLVRKYRTPLAVIFAYLVMRVIVFLWFRQ
ncbi:MAG TPA: serine/threonine-protein kinase [Thermoanaerobaculia bacterium]|nr:serine/threonine-protein kinase [Thermoanaerobaculia bacterium]